MTGSLGFADEVVIHMDEHSYMWVSMKRFRIQADASDSQLIQGLLEHRQYRDDYAGEDPAAQDQETVHGPYRLDAIRPECFEPMEALGAEALLNAWTRQFDATVDSTDRLASEVHPVLETGSLYYLAGMSPEAQHDWGWVVGGSGFHEFIAIDRTRGLVTLIVASDD